MNVIKRDSNRIIVARTLIDRLRWLLILPFLFFLYWVPHGFDIFLLCVIGLLILGRMTVDGRKLTIDKTTGNIFSENRFFLFFKSKRVIPFGSISSVLIDYKSREKVDLKFRNINIIEGFGIDWFGFGNLDKWKIFLDIGGDIVEVADRHGEKYDWTMSSLAYEIASLISKQGVDLDGKVTYGPGITLEQIDIVKTRQEWKKQSERKHAEKSKKQLH